MRSAFAVRSLGALLLAALALAGPEAWSAPGNPAPAPGTGIPAAGVGGAVGTAAAPAAGAPLVLVATEFKGEHAKVFRDPLASTKRCSVVMLNGAVDKAGNEVQKPGLFFAKKELPAGEYVMTAWLDAQPITTVHFLKVYMTAGEKKRTLSTVDFDAVVALAPAPEGAGDAGPEKGAGKPAEKSAKPMAEKPDDGLDLMMGEKPAGKASGNKKKDGAGALAPGSPGPGAAAGPATPPRGYQPF
ncbi:MAG: hypothetical protein NTW19_02330, partial [Planctomycetota bacterium]|nr:hypothetical protein [Planctomycetota bacterium]